MIDRDHALPITRQASLLGMSRGSGLADLTPDEHCFAKLPTLAMAA